MRRFTVIVKKPAKVALLTRRYIVLAENEKEAILKVKSRHPFARSEKCEFVVAPTTAGDFTLGG